MDKNPLLKRLNKAIIEWENLYGDYYTFLYNSDGSIKNPETIDPLFDNLHICCTVMQVLHNIKRNRNKNIKNMPKRKYKIESGYKKENEHEVHVR